VVRLELGEYRAKLDQALAVQQQAAADLERFDSLFGRGAATRAELDAALSRARVAEAAVNEARAMLGHSEIAAPFDGVVARKLADVGDLAVPGRPLVEIEDPTALRVEADVGESLIDGIEVGQELEVRVPGLAAPLRATVTEVAPTADRASRTFVVKADLPRTPGLRAGTFARVAVTVAQADTLRVPAEALVVRGQLEFVFVANDGKAELRLVKTGKSYGAEVELLAGVSAGERVVVSGTAGLVDGQPLRIDP
jgi:RND family efflux transporter MFP subunit